MGSDENTKGRPASLTLIHRAEFLERIIHQDVCIGKCATFECETQTRHKQAGREL
jgi:hypothetical protein